MPVKIGNYATYYASILPIMPALCPMLLITYYASNYAGIIGRSLAKGQYSTYHIAQQKQIDIPLKSAAAYVLIKLR